MTARADTGARRLGGLLLAFVLVASQASAWFHAVAITHVACLEHGEAVHGGAVPADPADGAPAAPASDATAVQADADAIGGHDHCGNAALLRWRDVAPTAPAALARPVPASRSIPPVAGPSDVRGGAVYLLAPKTSPPSACV
jgi:hypothetical protein